jgi:hypothetical protein
MSKCTNAQMHKCRNAGMQECRNAGMQECRNARMHECTNARMHECTNAALVHSCIIALLHYCNFAVRPRVWAAGGDLEGRPPGEKEGVRRLTDDSRHDRQSSRTAGCFQTALQRRYAANIVFCCPKFAFTGVAVSTRMNEPLRVRNRNFASTRAPRSASHDASSRPHSRRACASVRHSPGISMNSP